MYHVEPYTPSGERTTNERKYSLQCLYEPSRHIITRDDGLAECEGVVGKLQHSDQSPHYHNRSGLKKVECVDGTFKAHTTQLREPNFQIKVTSRSKSGDTDLVFPEGAVEIEQHYYTGDVVEGHYGEVDKVQYPDDVIIKEVPVYHKEIEEVVKRERVVNKIVERIPKYNYHDTYVDVEKVIEKPVYKEVPVKKIVTKEIRRPVTEERHIEKVRYIPTPEEVEVERIVDVPGDVIHQVRHVPRDELILTSQHVDVTVPVVVSQVVEPTMRDTKRKVKIPAKTLTPDLYTAPVRVPKPVDIDYHVGDMETHLEWTGLTAEEYNSAFFQLNTHLGPDHRRALQPNVHLYIDQSTGLPLQRNDNLKFYRLGEEALDNLKGYRPYNFSQHRRIASRPRSRSRSRSVVPDTPQISTAQSFVSNSANVSLCNVSLHAPKSVPAVQAIVATPRSPLKESMYVSTDVSQETRQVETEVEESIREVSTNIVYEQHYETGGVHDAAHCKICSGVLPCSLRCTEAEVTTVVEHGPVTYEYCDCNGCNVGEDCHARRKYKKPKTVTKAIEVVPAENKKHYYATYDGETNPPLAEIADEGYRNDVIELDTREYRTHHHHVEPVQHHYHNQVGSGRRVYVEETRPVVAETKEYHTVDHGRRITEGTVLTSHSNRNSNHYVVHDSPTRRTRHHDVHYQTTHKPHRRGIHVNASTVGGTRAVAHTAGAVANTATRVAANTVGGVAGVAAGTALGAAGVAAGVAGTAARIASNTLSLPGRRGHRVL